MSDFLPLFVYGTLTSGGSAHELVAAAVSGARPASVRGLRCHRDTTFPTVSFAEAVEDIEGELLWLDEASFQETVERLDRYEGVPDLFERVTVTASCEGRSIEAYAYSYVG